MQLHTPWWLLLGLLSVSSVTAAQNGTEGIDLLEVHPPVNWKAAVADGVKFVYVKATEGINYQNLRFPAQTDSARAAGILHGAVHFATAAESSGADQADFFIEHGGNWTADGRTLPGVLEMEGNVVGVLCHGMTPTEITDWMLDFSHRYKFRTGRAPMLFISPEWWANCAGNNATLGADHPLWFANWAEEMGTLPPGWKEATLWQYAGLSENGGEANVFLGSSEDLVKFAMGAEN